MILQLNPPIPVITPSGNGYAHVLIDYSQEHNLCWVVFQDDTGECWTWQNKDIRIQTNQTLGRGVVLFKKDEAQYLCIHCGNKSWGNVRCNCIASKVVQEAIEKFEKDHKERLKDLKSKFDKEMEKV